MTHDSDRASHTTEPRNTAGKTSRWPRLALAGVLLLFAGQGIVGVHWGLPSRAADKYLFSDGDVWSGEKIHRLAQAGKQDRGDRNLGADVDADALDRSTGQPIALTATDEDIAAIYLRYRLFTQQPDEMITMMALSGMRPGKIQLDPKLYQYGGLFIYPVGALVKAGGWLGLIDVRGDLVFYLDHPDEFGKFYLVSRGYAAAWGWLGCLIVFLIARRLSNEWGGVLAALLFAVMPVVVCMSHEGKPHLPGAVLMLLAVWLGMRVVSHRPGRTRDAAGSDDMDDVASPQETLPQPLPVRERGKTASRADEPGRVRCADHLPPLPARAHAGRTRDWWLMCATCGAALGMVLSSLPIFVLIPLVALLVWRSERIALTAARAVLGGLLAAGVYLITNPYILINALTNRDLLQSNFGNSLAMYQADPLAGLGRALALSVEGGSWPLLLLGALSFALAIKTRCRPAWVSAVPAGVFLLQFVMLAAGKPAEYGRFSVFPNTVMAIGVAAMLMHPLLDQRRLVRGALICIVVGWTALGGVRYLAGFIPGDAADHERRLISETTQYESKNGRPALLAVLVEPAPYACPPLDFRRLDVVLYPDYQAAKEGLAGRFGYFLQPQEEGNFVPAAGVGSMRDRTGEPTDLPTSWWEAPISWSDKRIYREVDD